MKLGSAQTIGAVACCIAIGAMQVGPILHQLQHAWQHQEHLRAVDAQPDHVHAETASLSGALDGDGHASLLCHACSTVLQAVPFPPIETAPLPSADLAAACTADGPTSRSLLHVPIRGPPAVT